MKRRSPRAVAEWRLDVEEALGVSVIDALFDGYLETGSVGGAGRVVSERTGVAIPVDVVRTWWNEERKRDPTFVPDAITAHSIRREERVAYEEAVEAERSWLLHKIAQVRAALDGHHCWVCGAPAVDFPLYVTCSSTCAELWRETRYHINDDYRARHQRCGARIRLRENPGDTWATHVLAGEPTQDYGRWTNSPTMTLALFAVMDRRAAARRRWGDLAALLPPPPALDNQPIIGTATYSA